MISLTDCHTSLTFVGLVLRHCLQAISFVSFTENYYFTIPEVDLLNLRSVLSCQLISEYIVELRRVVSISCTKVLFLMT